MITLAVDNRYVTIRGADRRALRMLETCTSYLVSGYYFSPAYRAHRWDGREHLLKYSSAHGYRVPIGLLMDVAGAFKKGGVAFDIDLSRRVAPGATVAFEWNPACKLRDYQIEAIESILKPGITRGSGILKMPIRSGKTKTSAGLIHRLGVRTLFLVPSQMLLHQTREALGEALNVDIGIIGDSEWIEKDITVATLQTLTRARGGARKGKNGNYVLPTDPRYKPLMESFGLMILDECFVGGTRIGDTPIEKIREGDSVCSYNEVTGEIARNKVTRVFKNKADKLMRIVFSNRENIVCTLNHPFLTKNGWTPACMLNSCSDMVLSITEEERHEMYFLQNSNNENQQGTKGSLQDNRKNLLYEGMWRKIQEDVVFDEPSFEIKEDEGPKFRENEEKESNVESSLQSKGGSLTPSESDPMGSTKEGREWSTNTNSGNATVDLFGLANRGSRISRKKTIWIPNELQVGHSEFRSKNSDRSGREIPFNMPGSCSGQEKRPHLEWVRVDSITFLEQGGNGEFERVCRDGYVYNLEIENDHTYFANGIVVHNCHHSKAEAWHLTIMDFAGLYRVGLSATIYLDNVRENERGVIWVKACCGRVKIDVPTSRLVKAGYLMTQNVEMHTIDRPDLSGRKWCKKLQDEAIYENPVRNAKIVELVKQRVGEDLCVLVISNRHNQISLLAQALDATSIPFDVIIGSDDTTTRKRKVESFKKGDTKVLIGTVFGEGVDIPEVEVVINAEGGRDVKATVQRQRNLTPHADKREAVFIDFIDETNQYFLRHSRERLATYRAESAFNVKIVE
jgi:superfamily II DNA or RNA helicase